MTAAIDTRALDAVRHGPMELDVLECLLTAGAPATAISDEGWNVLHYLCGANDHPPQSDRPYVYRDRIQQICRLIKMAVDCGADVNARANDWAPIMYAVQYRPVAVVEQLLAQGARLKGKNNLGDTVFHYAARTAGEVEVIQAILKAGGDPHATNKKGDTPLVLCAYRFTVSELKFLYDVSPLDDPKLIKLVSSLQHSGALDAIAARITIPPATMGPALCDTIKNNRVQMALRLIELGADPNFEDTVGDALSYAIEKANRPLVEALLANGAILGEPEKFGKFSRLLLASLRGDPDLIDLLISHGADVHAQHLGAPVLAQVCYYALNPGKGSKVGERLYNNILHLARLGLNPDAHRPNEPPPLFFLCGWGELSKKNYGSAYIQEECSLVRAAEALIESGANVDRVHENYTALDCAVEVGWTQTQNLLQTHGARHARDMQN